MTISGLEFRAYWGPRKESLEQCSDKLINFLNGMKEKHFIFQSWCKRENPSKKITLTCEAIKFMLHQGANRNDEHKKIIEELGFGICLWNGLRSKDKSCDLRLTCAMYFNKGSNNLMLDVPEANDFLVESFSLSLLQFIAEIWNPDYGYVCRESFSIALGESRGRGPIEDWLLFVNNSANITIKTKKPPVKEIPSLGKLYVLGKPYG